MTGARVRAFVALARLSERLPSFRGRTRLLLLLHAGLGLRKKHIHVDTLLRQPVPYRARLDLHSWLQRIAFLTGGYEAETVDFLLRLHRSIGRPGFLLDVGANVGLISIPAARMLKAEGGGPGGSGPAVVAVEAVGANAGALRVNVTLNGAEGEIDVIGEALGEEEKTAEIQVEGDLEEWEGTGTANILAEGSAHRCTRIPIRVTTLDTLVRAGRLTTGCSVMKIDTDGYDLKVLQGGGEFLERSRPVVFGEFSAHCLRWHGQTVSDVDRFAAGIGYRAWQRREGRGFGFRSRIDPDTFCQDLLLVPEEDEERLSWCISDEKERRASRTSTADAIR